MASSPKEPSAPKEKPADERELIRELAILLDETNLTEIEIERAGLRLRVARNISIAACYIDVTNFKAYSASRGAEGQERALKFMGNAVTSLIRSAGIYESFVSHMGGEHFVVLVMLEDYERFCSSLMEAFDQNVKKLYTQEEGDRGFITARDKRGNEGEFPLMALSIGVAHNQFRQIKSAKKMLEILAQVRQMAKPRGKSALFVDRRRTDR